MTAINPTYLVVRLTGTPLAADVAGRIANDVILRRSMPLLDRFSRPLRSLRLSATNLSNLRCQYCIPEPDYLWLPRESRLTFEETAAIVDAFTPLGVDRVRITGGEPLLRRDLPVLIES